MIKGFVLGALVGGVVTWVLAPRSGQETRELVRERGQMLRASARNATLRAQDVARDQAAKVQSTARTVLPRSDADAEAEDESTGTDGTQTDTTDTSET